jgi:hypothetical protein
MKLFLIACALPASIVVAQEPTQPWPKWPERDAKKILENSARAQTQVQTNISQMFPNAGQRTMNPDQRLFETPVDPNPNQLPGNDLANSVNYYIRSLSAKPVRQALARVEELHQQNADPQSLKELRDFVESRFDQWIVLRLPSSPKTLGFPGR